jgi:O-methyltransferase involved in polyketide biosynthesis
MMSVFPCDCDSRVYNSMPGGSGRWYVGLGSGFEYRFPRLNQAVRMDDKDST